MVPNADSLTESISSAQTAAAAALDKVNDAFSQLEANFYYPIDFGSVQSQLKDQLDTISKLAANPSAIIGAGGCIASCIFPLAELSAVLNDALAQLNSLISTFSGGAFAQFMDLINKMVDSLKGIGSALSTTVGAIGEVSTVTNAISNGFAGAKEDKLKAASDIEIFVDKADFKLTSKMISGVLGSLEKIMSGGSLDSIAATLVSFGNFITEIPQRLTKIMTPNPVLGVCISVPKQITDLLNMLYSLSGAFDPYAIQKALDTAKLMTGVSAASITGPLESMDRALTTAASGLKLASNF